MTRDDNNQDEATMKSYSGTHYFKLEQEYVSLHNGPTYLVDRERERLVNVANPNDVLELQQQQFDAQGEFLEHYAAADDPENSMVIDSSPRWLDYIRSL